MLARYQSTADFFNQFQPQDVIDQIVNSRLREIEEFVRNALP